MWIPNIFSGLSSFWQIGRSLSAFKVACLPQGLPATGSPQGTVLSPLLFTLYTKDCAGSPVTPLINYSNDSALQDLSNSHPIYLKEIDKFLTWCNDNYLNLHVKKTTEFIIDFRRNPELIPDLVVNGEQVHVCNSSSEIIKYSVFVAVLWATTYAPDCTAKPACKVHSKPCTIILFLSDVNECLVDNGGCMLHTYCQNNMGSYQCVCETGYSMNPDGYSCSSKW